MKIIVRGKQYGDFVTASVTQRLDALSSSFTFTATSDDARPLPFRGGESCLVTVDGELALTGHIELVNVNGGSNQHAITFQGRDDTADLLDSTLGSLEPMQGAAVTLLDLCVHVIQHIGASIQVIDQASPAAFDITEDIEDPELGTNAFTWLEKYSRKRQVLLTSDSLGHLVIAQNEGVEVPGAFIQNQIGDPGNANNVLQYSVSYDSTGRFNVYQMVSQGNLVPLAETGETSADSIIDQGSAQSFVDADIRAGRQLALVSEAVSSTGSALTRAEWEQKIRAARGSVYSATVHGYRNQAGELWTPNTIVSVRDDDAGIQAKMLINSVTFSLGDDGGRSTVITMIRPDAYSLTFQKPAEDELGYGLAGEDSALAVEEIPSYTLTLPPRGE